MLIQFMKFLKNMPKNIRKNIPFINEKSLNELKQYYVKKIILIENTHLNEYSPLFFINTLFAFFLFLNKFIFIDPCIN